MQLYYYATPPSLPFSSRLVVGVVLYCVIGSVIMYNVKGARGAEVIPNHSFWKDLPFLIVVCGRDIARARARAKRLGVG